MKRLIIILLGLAFCIYINAQVKVVTDGKVAIGTTATPLSTLSVGYQGSSSYLASFKTSGTNSGIYVRNSGPAALDIRNSPTSNTSTTGINVQPFTLGDYVYAPRYGIISYGGNSYFVSIGVAGSCRHNNPNISLYQPLYAGIYGSVAYNINPSNEVYKGIYAGFFSGDARVTGSLYATVLTPSGTSGDTEAIESATTLSDSEESVSERLSRVQMLTFNREAETKMLKERAAMEAQNVSLALASDDSQEDILNVEDAEEIPQTKLSAVRFGLAADQLKEVYPELVYEDQAGNVSINYIEMVPLLLQYINELNERVAELEGEQDLKSLKKVQAAKNVTSIISPDEITLSLGQNNPNPFSDQTSIEVSVPESVQKAVICIYDMGGKQVAGINIQERGISRVSLLASDLYPGMFLYTLIADGKVAGTKKMIVTK